MEVSYKLGAFENAKLDPGWCSHNEVEDPGDGIERTDSDEGSRLQRRGCEGGRNSGWVEYILPHTGYAGDTV